MILFRFNLGLAIVFGSFACDVLSVGEAVEGVGSRIPMPMQSPTVKGQQQQRRQSVSYCNADTLHNASYPILPLTRL